MKNKKLIIIFSAILLLSTFFGVAYFYWNQEMDRLSETRNKNQDLFIRDHSPTLGPDNAPVVLVEFLDPECETCKAFHPFVKQLMSDYPEKIKLVARYAPFHGNSQYVVRILEASRLQDKYWETLNLVFQYQPQWGRHHNPQVELIWDYLLQIDVDIEQIKQDMNAPQITKILEQDIEDGKNLGVRQTPTFFINSKPLQSFGYQQLRNAIELELKKST